MEELKDLPIKWFWSEHCYYNEKDRKYINACIGMIGPDSTRQDLIKWGNRVPNMTEEEKKNFDPDAKKKPFNYDFLSVSIICDWDDAKTHKKVLKILRNLNNKNTDLDITTSYPYSNIKQVKNPKYCSEYEKELKNNHRIQIEKNTDLIDLFISLGKKLQNRGYCINLSPGFKNVQVEPPDLEYPKDFYLEVQKTRFDNPFEVKCHRDTSFYQFLQKNLLLTPRK